MRPTKVRQVNLEDGAHRQVSVRQALPAREINALYGGSVTPVMSMATEAAKILRQSFSSEDVSLTVTRDCLFCNQSPD